MRVKWQATTDAAEVKAVQSALIQTAANLVHAACGVDDVPSDFIRQQALAVRDAADRLGKNHAVGHGEKGVRG